MPPDLLDHAVDVLEKLPRQAALADARLAGDRHESNPPLSRRRVEQVLEQPQLGVAADEGGLEAVVAAAATTLGDDPEGTPRDHRKGLALQVVLAGRLVRDGVGRRLVGRVADEDGPGRRG